MNGKGKIIPKADYKYEPATEETKMIYMNKDITTIDVGIVVHGVNCKRVMNSGVAKAIRTKWPIAYDTYLSSLGSEMVLGNIQIVEIKNSQLYVVNAFTQMGYGRNPGTKYVSYDAIYDCFHLLGKYLLDLPVNKNFVQAAKFGIYIPRIGAGLGGGNWSAIEPIIVDGLAEARKYNSYHIFVCDFSPDTQHQSKGT